MIVIFIKIKKGSNSDPLFGGVRCIENRCTLPRYNGFKCDDDRECYSGLCADGNNLFLNIDICFGKKLVLFL
jgi:hypothetical protein